MSDLPEIDPLGQYYTVFSTISIVFAVILGMLIAPGLANREYTASEFANVGVRLFCLSATVLCVMQFGALLVSGGFGRHVLSFFITAVALIYIQPIGTPGLLVNAGLWYTLMIAWMASCLVTALGIRLGMSSTKRSGAKR